MAIMTLINKDLTLRNLQEHIKSFDYKPDQISNYFFKLIEEVGELSEVMRKNVRMKETGEIKGTIEEELHDIMYYVLALANIYEIDLEECFIKKDEINRKKWCR